jgi:hypothetical protein
MGMLGLYNHPLALSVDYVNRYSAGHLSESEDVDYHVLEHIQFLLDVEETDPWWLVHQPTPGRSWP